MLRMSNRWRTGAGGVIAALAVAVAASFLPSAASSQSCRIADGSIANSLARVGSVQTFGDLKMRIIQYGDNDGRFWVDIDLKTPTGQLNGIRLFSDSPAQKVTMCGQDVSISYAWGYLTVGVF